MTPKHTIVVGLAVTCVLMGCEPTFNSPSALGWYYESAILYGHGEEKPRGSDLDYMSAYLDFIAREEPLQASVAGISFACAFAGGTKYGNLTVAYAMHGRAREAMDTFKTLIRTRFTADTCTRLNCVEAWLVLRRAEYYFCELKRPMAAPGLRNGYPKGMGHHELDRAKPRAWLEEYLLEHDPEYAQMTEELKRLKALAVALKLGKLEMTTKEADRSRTLTGRPLSE